MDPFFNISNEEDLPNDTLSLKDLGLQRAWITTGRRGSKFWGTSDTPSKTIYKDTKDEDYGQQFVRNSHKCKPIYKIDSLLESIRKT